MLKFIRKGGNDGQEIRRGGIENEVTQKFRIIAIYISAGAAPQSLSLFE
jgi:hypothetical protein